MPGAPPRILEIDPKGDFVTGAAIQLRAIRRLLGDPAAAQAMARAGRTP